MGADMAESAKADMNETIKEVYGQELVITFSLLLCIEDEMLM